MSILVIGQHYWGHGNTLAEAKKNFREEGGILSKGYAIIEFRPGLTFKGVNSYGFYTWSGGGEPTITEVKPR